MTGQTKRLVWTSKLHCNCGFVGKNNAETMEHIMKNGHIKNWIHTSKEISLTEFRQSHKTRYGY